jgi:hypothetical protein
MEKKNIFLLSLIFLFNYICSQQYDFKMGETIEEKIVNRRYYKVPLTNKQAEYVIVSVRPSDEFEKYSDPDIYISKVSSMNFLNPCTF